VSHKCTGADFYNVRLNAVCKHGRAYIRVLSGTSGCIPGL